jgi:hypothetical protein
MRRIWIRGAHTTVETKNTKGQVITLTGKNGGPIIKQDVALVFAPKV